MASHKARTFATFTSAYAQTGPNGNAAVRTPERTQVGFARSHDGIVAATMLAVSGTLQGAILPTWTTPFALEAGTALTTAK